MLGTTSIAHAASSLHFSWGFHRQGEPLLKRLDRFYVGHFAAESGGVISVLPGTPLSDHAPVSLCLLSRCSMAPRRDSRIPDSILQDTELRTVLSQIWVFSRLGSRSIQYGDCQDYVLIEPGKEELFVDLEELRARLRNWLENWPGRSLPSDLAGFENLDDAVTYLVENACELDITDGSGTVQWFGVRL
ncbi:hypothetical protein L7F22_001928 [Adiantum nelumboides]|nr:hypothetical protein [Adiantum nelumboides]